MYIGAECVAHVCSPDSFGIAPPPPAFSKEEEEGWGRGSHRKVSASSAPCWSHVCRREDIDCAFVEFLYRGISVEKEPRDFRFRPL